MDISDGSPTGIGCRHLSVRYGAHQALYDVSVTIPIQQITAVIGPSGCGKSSFLATWNRLTDLYDHCHVTGEMWLHGEDVLSREVDLIRLRRRVGMIFQTPNPFPLSIKRNIQLPLRETGIRDRDRLDFITERVLQDVGLWDETKDRLNRSALSLSGGQQQRLCIARALALQPQLLLFDEPCSALDPISSGIVEDLIHELRQQATIVIVTHNISQARRIADHVAMFWYDDGVGKLVEHCAAAKAFTAPDNPITAAYIDGSRG